MVLQIYHCQTGPSADCKPIVYRRILHIRFCFYGKYGRGFVSGESYEAIMLYRDQVRHAQPQMLMLEGECRKYFLLWPKLEIFFLKF